MRRPLGERRLLKDLGEGLSGGGTAGAKARSWGWPVGGQCGWSRVALGESGRKLTGQGPFGAVGSYGRLWSDILELPWWLYGEWQCRRDLTAEEKPKEREGGGTALGKRHGICE